MKYNTISQQAEAAWKRAWDGFFCRKTNLFYEFPSDLLEYLPTPEEIAQCKPNRTGWNAGMEDGSINAGIMMEAVLYRYEVTHDTSMGEYAKSIFEGIKLCSTTSPVKGFLIRAVSPKDGKSHYPVTSRDQYTHVIQGLLKFYHSSLSTREDKEAIREILSSYADFIEETTTLETDYTFPSDDGGPSCGICKLWNRNSWADARFPIYFAAAWDVTRKEKYKELFLKYAEEAVDRTLKMPVFPVEGFLQYQIQISLEIIRNISFELFPKLPQKCERAMKMIADQGTYYALHTTRDEFIDAEFCKPWEDWRKAKDFYGEPPFRIPLRDSAIKRPFELMRNGMDPYIIQCMTPGWKISEFLLRLFKERFLSIDFETIASSGVIYAVAAYWTLCASGYDFELK